MEEIIDQQDPLKPEQMPEKSRSKIVFRNALIFTFILIIILLLTHMMREKMMEKNQSIAWGEYALLFGAIIVTQMQVRTDIFQNRLSFSQAFTSGMLFVILVALMFAVFVLIFYSFIGHEMLDEMKTLSENTLRDKGKSEEEIKTAMSFTGRIFTPVGMCIMTVIGYCFVGTIESLIASLFTQRSN